MGLNDEILDFVRTSFYGCHGPWIFFFFWFFGDVSKQSDQVSRKPDFWLRTGNNDPKQKDKS